MNISKRIYEICQCIEFESLADIGTDHSYLPIAAIQGGFAKKAIGIDVNKGPLKIALSNIKEAGLADFIELRLGSGLEPLGFCEAQTIVISGMGGLLINNIIEKSLETAHSAKQLILSPQSDVSAVRRNLHDLGFLIYDEKFISDGGKFYNIILAKPGVEEKYTDFQYEFGRILLNSPKPEFLDYLKKTINSYESILERMEISQNIQNDEKRSLISHKHKLIGDYLKIGGYKC